jgi:RNA polymerase sigma-70 factor, ECF subfamily
VKDTDTFRFVGWVSDLARTHTRALSAVARAEGLVGEDALEAVQEAFITFLGLPQARSLVDVPDDSEALMRTIVRNAARNARRRHHRAKPHVAITDNVIDVLPGVDHMLMEAESHVQLTGCVGRLGDVQRRVVVMRMLHELSGAETGEALGIDAAYVAVLLHRAKNELLRCMS